VAFRYLRNADVKRIRESVRERNTLMRLGATPDRPASGADPTYRWGIQNRDVMRVAIWLYDRLAADRNRGITDSALMIPEGGIVSRQQCLDLVPGINPDGITGGSDLVRRQPAGSGAADARGRALGQRCGGVCRELRRGDGLPDGGRSRRLAYAPATARRQRIRGSRRARDQGLRSVDEPYAAVAWRGAGRNAAAFVRTVDAVVRPLTRGGHGLAFMGSKPGRPDESMRYFIAPWRGYSVIGSVDYMHGTDADHFKVEQSELEELLVATRQAIPGAKLTIDDIIGVQVGLIPHDDTQPLDDPYNAARHYRIEDPRRTRRAPRVSCPSWASSTRPRATLRRKPLTSRFASSARTAAPSTSAERPLHYGHVASLAQLLSAAERSATASLDAVRVRELAALYGPKYSTCSS
jgi:glycerol-3-phosphate dehydrogenase